MQTITLFANNLSLLYKMLKRDTILTLKNTVSDIAHWMSEMQLKLNQDKTELILFGFRR